MQTEPTEPYRVGVVEYINTLPLIDGLEGLSEVRLCPAVPSRLIGLLVEDEVDLALSSIIDYQNSPVALKILPAGLLGCEGSTMTVRLFSQVPLNRLTRIHCDTDSHTSVMLLRVLLHERYHLRPELVDFRPGRDKNGDGEDSWPEAVLLIGDKVVTDATPAIRYPYQMDLGAEWRDLTSLPFVFAAWQAKRDRDDLAPLAAVLDRQRRHNLERLDDIVGRAAPGHGWPADLARVYLRERICYEWTPEAVAGVKVFFEKTHALGLIDENRPLVFDPV